MDDMNAFERQMAGEIAVLMGPISPVDDLAILSDITAATTKSPKWRFQSMLSATKFVVAGAIVALFGGFLLIAQPFEQQSASVPGAATDDGPMAPVYVKASLLEQYGSYGTESETDEGMTRLEGGVMFGGAYSTDPRLRGTRGGEGQIHTLNYLHIDGRTKIQTNGIVIVNDGGRWVGTGIQAWSGDDEFDFPGGASPLGADGDFWTVMLSGMEGYEGLTALLWNLDDQSEWDLGGVIFEGDMPAIPEDWCALARDDIPAAVARVPDPNNIAWMERDTRRACPSVEIPD
jgi:hypothetical protein